MQVSCRIHYSLFNVENLCKCSPVVSVPVGKSMCVFVCVYVCECMYPRVFVCVFVSVYVYECIYPPRDLMNGVTRVW